MSNVKVLSLFLFALSILVHEDAAADRPGNFYRIEVNFTRFETKDSKTYLGYYCDSLTACDPQTYAKIELDYASSSTVFGRIKEPEKLVLVHSQCCANVYNMTSSNQIVRTICEVGKHATPKSINVQVEVRDKDLFTPYDVIEQFNCGFAFRPGGRATSERWSDETACQPVHGPHQIR